ncbi:Hint domain-containing protein [Maliponia aquimaris]|uniref:Hint domain-containing protein n=1 Tax=Maliponia aquimaris TaxID=1673631 RepID=UPI001595C224|nr:Hint domain-containing protein [Maliponia aquimaris]
MDDADTGASLVRAVPAAEIGVLRGTRVKTLRGEVAAEALRPGDRVLTRDNGYQPVDWTGRAAPLLSGSGRAVRLRKGALGRGMPERCLWVAPGQRLLIGGERLSATFGQPEVLVDARHLTCLSGVALCAAPPLPLVQVRLDRHELILCEGTWCDSLLGGPDRQDSPARPVLQGDDLRAVLRLLAGP